MFRAAHLGTLHIFIISPLAPGDTSSNVHFKRNFKCDNYFHIKDPDLKKSL